MTKNTLFAIAKHLSAYFTQHAAAAGISLLILSTFLLAAHLAFGLKSNATLVFGFIMMAAGIAATIKAAGTRR